MLMQFAAHLRQGDWKSSKPDASNSRSRREKRPNTHTHTLSPSFFTSL